jgi:hypothetical protein
VQDNLRFYEIQRARLGQPAANAEPAPPAVRVGTAPAAPVQAVSLR